MPRKISKISKKVALTTDDVPLPKEGEKLGIVERMLGGDRLVVVVDGEEKMVRIPGKFRGQLLMRKGSYVLLEQVIEGANGNYRIIYRYSSDEAECLASMGVIGE